MGGSPTDRRVQARSLSLAMQGRTVFYTDGTHAHTDVQRPEFVYDEIAGVNTHLINGAFLGAIGNLSSFTLMRPIAH